MITVDHRKRDVTVVAFSGLAPRNSMFEWVKSFRDLPCNFVGVRDPENDWYQTRKDEIADLIEEATDRAHKRVFVGASAGGFAALMYGQTLEADAVLAFSPQSACGQAKRDLGDMRWPKYCDSTPSCDIGGKHNATVCYAVDDEMDRMHAHRLDCRCEAYPTGGHHLVDRLKQHNYLSDLILTAVRR